MRDPASSPETLGSLGSFHKSTPGASLYRVHRVSLGTERDGDVGMDPRFETAGWKSEMGGRKGWREH